MAHLSILILFKRNSSIINWFPSQRARGLSQYKSSYQQYSLTSIAVPILRIIRYRDRLIFNMKIPIPVKDGAQVVSLIVMAVSDVSIFVTVFQTWSSLLHWTSYAGKWFNQLLKMIFPAKPAYLLSVILWIYRDQHRKYGMNKQVLSRIAVGCNYSSTP